MLVHGPVAEAETWIWNARAYAGSQFRVTPQMFWLLPRSTWIHCGSLNALDQRVPVLPSKALAGANAPSCEEALAGRPCAALAVPQPPPPPPMTPYTWNS